MANARKIAYAPVLIAQAIATRQRALKLPEAAGERQGTLGDARLRTLRLLIAGDSSAAGVGVEHQEDAVVGHLVRTVHRLLGGSVAWSLRARSGLTTKGLLHLLRLEPPDPTDVAIVITGVNDVVCRVSAARAVAHRALLVDWLIGRGLARHVVFAPLPPIHRFPLLPEPLRRVMGDDAARHDLALARFAATRDDVSHAEVVLDLHAGVMASDGFHPGAPVYRACGEQLGAHVAKTVAATELARCATAGRRELATPSGWAVAGLAHRSRRR